MPGCDARSAVVLALGGGESKVAQGPRANNAASLPGQMSSA